MSRTIEGEHRHQFTLFPELLDDYISEDNSVRVIEAFVEEFFSQSQAKADPVPKAKSQ